MSPIRPGIFNDRVLAAVSTREGGVSRQPYGMNLSFRVGDDPAHVEQNRRLFFGNLSIDLTELAIPSQVHSTTIVRADAPGVFPSCDALFTTVPRVFLCVTIADCVPVLVHAPDVGAVAAIHAGWRGTASGIVARAIDTMTRELDCNPSLMKVYLGPAASVCCYSVGSDVAQKLGEPFVRREGETIYADLKSANLAQLTGRGIDSRNVEISAHCTVSEPSRFHSYRRDRESSGRMMAVIGLLR